MIPHCQALQDPLDQAQYRAFKEKLAEVQKILYLGDNTGEIVCDKILIEKLVQRGKKVTFVTRGEPTINDASSSGGNSGHEAQKSEVLPEEAEKLVRDLSQLQRVQVQGLMTMGPRFGDPDLARPYFQETKHLFDQLSKLGIKNVEMRYLSMGMSNTYEIAIEEGANMVRIGTKIFGEGDYK